MRSPITFLLIFSIIILAVDFYSYRGIKKLTAHFFTHHRRIVFFLFWSLPVMLISALIIFSLFNRSINPADYMPYFHIVSGGFILFYLPKLVFILFNFADDIILMVKKIVNTYKKPAVQTDPANSMTRKQFLNKLGIIIAAVPFASALYGITWGRFDFIVRKHKLYFKNLPAEFNGLRVVQFSDFHIGSFSHYTDEVKRAIDLINEQRPDLLLFTGDIVNNVADELERYMPILQNLEAGIGKYSVLGNHDYADYVRWYTDQQKQENMIRLRQMQDELGLQLLLNDSQKIFYKDNFIELLGVENWGLPPFPQYGDLEKTRRNVDKNAFKILMSHDPTHFAEQVKGTDIDLTLSGHTHGAQFGIEIPGWRWSPVDMRYTYWGGLYKVNEQYVNVNTGLGFIGFPGRVGMPPEITLFELYSGEEQA
ncbi:MAG: metallophosphoesterase [Calditrichaeota bacterium]|nr:metallophosphoesterase [Calditrichota bacterium]